MAISNDLFLPILAMDAYNRGYNAAVNIDGNQIGNATLLAAEGGEAAQAASFFAQAYTWNSQTIISYRGTDSIFGENGVTSDILTGWITGGGAYSSALDHRSQLHPSLPLGR